MVRRKTKGYVHKTPSSGNMYFVFTVTGLFTRCSGGTGILIGYLIPNYIPPSPINFSPPAEQIYIYIFTWTIAKVTS